MGVIAEQQQHNGNTEGGDSLHNELAAGKHGAARVPRQKCEQRHSNEVIIPPNLSDHQIKLNQM